MKLSENGVIEMTHMRLLLTGKDSPIHVTDKPKVPDPPTNVLQEFSLMTTSPQRHTYMHLGNFVSHDIRLYSSMRSFKIIHAICKYIISLI